MQILGISGSLRSDSWNTKLLRAAAEIFDAQDVEFEIFDGLKAVPPYDEEDDVDPAPAAVARLREALAGADGVLFATPEYNSSIPGVLKNALDWASRPFPDNALRAKPTAVVGASTGLFGAIWAQAELRKVLAAAGAKVIDEELPVGHAQDAFDEDGALASPDTAERLREIIALLVSQAEQLEMADSTQARARHAT